MKVTVPLMLLLLLGLTPLTDLTYLPAQEGEVQADLSLLLPDEKGKILVASYCSMCHSLKNVLVGIRNQEQWANTIDKMVFEYNAPISDEEAELMSAYLGKYAGLDNPLKDIPMDLNSVSGKSLARLPFLSTEEQKSILEFRTAKEPLINIEQLTEVLDRKTVDALRPYLKIQPR